MLKNIGSNWFLMAVSGLSTLVLMPYNLAHLGASQYGLWLVISALTAYLFLLHLGVPMASVRQMTQAIASGDTVALNQVITTCAALYLALGVLVGVLGIPLLLYFEQSYRLQPDLQSLARLAFVLSLIWTGISFIANMPYAILSAHQAFVPTNMLMTFGIAVRLAINLALVLVYPNLAALAVVNLAVCIIEAVAAWSYVLRTYPEIRPRLADFRRDTVHSIVGFSVFVFLMALGSQLSFQTSALVIGHLMTSADVVSFAVPNSLMLILMQFLGGIASVIMPVTTNLQTRGEWPALREVLHKWTKISLALSWCAGSFLFVFGPAFLALWINSAYTPEAGLALRILTASYLIFLPVRSVAVPMLMGLGKAKWPTIATLAAGVLNLVLSLIWVRSYGLVGAAWGTFVPNVLLSAALVALVCRDVSVPVRDYLLTAMPLATAGGLTGLAVLSVWQQAFQPAGLIGLAIAGGLTMLVSAFIWSQFVLRNDPHIVIPPLADLLQGKRPWAPT